VSELSETLRDLVFSRAAGRCEYCQLPSEGQVGRFPVDHILPRTAGGLTEPGNLALACHHCNAHKWSHQMGKDFETGENVFLYHPREQAWDDHFAWSMVPSIRLMGRTAVGLRRSSDFR
jgi:5-methylcytosine-specific restriction endonuclease McrA